MNCPSCKSQVDASAAVCPTCGWKFNTGGGQPGPSLVRPAARPKIQCEVELGITVDRTGSSEPFQVGIPLTFETIVRQVAAKARSVRCWVASHGDLDEGQAFVIHTDGGAPEQAIEDIKRVTYDGSGDAPENHLDAVESLLNTVPWTASPARARGNPCLLDGGFQVRQVGNLGPRPRGGDQTARDSSLPRVRAHADAAGFGESGRGADVPNYKQPGPGRTAKDRGPVGRVDCGDGCQRGHGPDDRAPANK